jgi:hypothetical protein
VIVRRQLAGVGCVLLVFLCAGAGGCGSSVTIPAWQQSVERYVRQQGQGDPTILRNTMMGNRHGFALLGGDDPKDVTDARGVLVAHQRIGDRPWFIYLVGLVRKQVAEDIQLAALTADNGALKWVTGPKNKQATQTYKRYNESLARQRFGDRKQWPPEYEGFPRPEDQFDLSVVGNHATVVHAQSGARWEMDLRAK